ncbi:hypothetical protein PRIPAC_97821 [Pristionchus pacificus]|uniref:Uncharacterized protein n=1 Tax=Pristionchus pacificus TaxID=54126 RepID=A0A2A6D133_PRIPA|nr:hypothetical protein PRIPAC_97821 [Pristionchus pacificus]|eukprot:PDM84056.1 hypothetical protein PRIPAC_34248 [Pristionchus pacificus]
MSSKLFSVVLLFIIFVYSVYSQSTGHLGYPLEGAVDMPVWPFAHAKFLTRAPCESHVIISESGSFEEEIHIRLKAELEHDICIHMRSEILINTTPSGFSNRMVDIAND